MQNTSTISRATVSVKEAAKILGVSASTIRSEVQRGRIPVVRVACRVLIPISVIERILACQQPQRKLSEKGARDA